MRYEKPEKDSSLAPLFPRYRIFMELFFYRSQDLQQNHFIDFKPEILPISRPQVEQVMYNISEFFNVVVMRYEFFTI
jgi:hypothetical protein